MTVTKKKRKFFIIKDDGIYFLRKGFKDKPKSKWGTKGIGGINVISRRNPKYSNHRSG